MNEKAKLVTGCCTMVLKNMGWCKRRIDGSKGGMVSPSQSIPLGLLVSLPKGMFPKQARMEILTCTYSVMEKGMPLEMV